MSNAPHPATLDVHGHSTVYRVRNLEHSIVWYERVLQIHIIFRDPHLKLVDCRTPCGVNLCLFEIREHEKHTPAGIESAYIVFIVHDVKVYRHRLTAEKVDVTEILDRLGVSSFWFSDPDHNQFCVLQFNYE